MLEQILIVLTQLSTLFIMIGVGYIIGRLNIVTKDGTKNLTGLMTKVSMPCAIINSLMMQGSKEFFVSIAVALVLIFAVTLISAFISVGCFRKKDPQKRGVLQMGMIYGNSAFMGIALVQAVLGQEAVIYATLIVIVETIFILCHAPLLMADGGKINVRKIILTPGVIAFVIGLVRLILNITLPGPIQSALTSLGAMNSPLAMIIVGLQLSRVDIKTTFTQVSLYLCAAIKLIILPVVLMIVLRPFVPAYLPAIGYCTICICKGTPQAAILSAFAEDYGQDAKMAAQLIALCSILQVVTLPIIAAVCQMMVA